MRLSAKNFTPHVVALTRHGVWRVHGGEGGATFTTTSRPFTSPRAYWRSRAPRSGAAPRKVWPAMMRPASIAGLLLASTTLFAASFVKSGSDELILTNPASL